MDLSVELCHVMCCMFAMMYVRFMHIAVLCTFQEVPDWRGYGCVQYMSQFA